MGTFRLTIERTALLALAMSTLVLGGCQCSKSKLSATIQEPDAEAILGSNGGSGAGGEAGSGGGSGGTNGGATAGDNLPFNVKIVGAVTVRPGASGAALTTSVEEVRASDFRVEALRISSGQTKVQLLAKTKTGTTGQYDVAVDDVTGNDTLLIVAYKDKVSSGQTLLPLRGYAPSGKDRIVEINLNVSTTTTIATWILLKKDIKLPDALTRENLSKVEELVESAIKALGKAIDGKSVIEIAEMVLNSPGFLDELERIFNDTIRDRDVCDANSWDFLRSRLPVQDVFGEPKNFVNLAAGVVAGTNGIFAVSPSRISPSSSLVWSGEDADSPIDQVVLELTENDLDSGITCYDPKTSTFGAECPTEIVTATDAVGAWEIVLDASVLRNGGIYIGALKAINSECNAVLAQASASLLWDLTPPAFTLQNLPANPTNGTTLSVVVSGLDVDRFAYAVLSGLAAASCENVASWSE